MKILHLVPTLSAGGAETFVTELAIAQREMNQEIDVFLLAGTRGARGKALRSALNRASIQCYNADAQSARDPRNAARLLRQIVAGRYDVVHAHLFSVELVLASLLPLLSALRAKPLLVRTLHNSNIYGTRSRIVSNMLARAFDWNFACGPNVLKNYSDLFGMHKVSTIENGVSAPKEQDDRLSCSVREELNLPAKAFVVTCIGAFRGVTLATSQKAQDVALYSFLTAFKSDPSAHLLLVGDGELRGEAEALALHLGAEGNIHFLGNLPNVQPVLRASNLLFMPSRYEGLPIAGLEAGCAGVPVLASSIDELMDVGKLYGWIYSEDNSVDDFARRLNAIRKNQTAITKRAQEMSVIFRKRYGIERCSQEYLNQLHNLLSKKKR